MGRLEPAAGASTVSCAGCLAPSSEFSKCIFELKIPRPVILQRFASTNACHEPPLVDRGTTQHRMARHDQSRVACVGWRLCVQPTAIAPYHPICVARLGSWLKARAKSSARIPKVARRRTRLRSWGAGRAVTPPRCRPDDLPRPSSSYLSQIARQISLVPMDAAHRTPTTCHLHRFAPSRHPVRVRLSAGWPEVEMAVMWAALPRSGT